MPLFRSSIAGQLAGFEREVKGIMTRVLFAGGNRFRNRMKRERLSGPPGLYVKTGRLRRSLKLVRQPGLGSSEIGIVYAIGGDMAPYAEEHEAAGRLGFRRVWGEEAQKTIEELRLAVQFVRGQGGVLAGAVDSAMGNITSTAASAEDLLQEETYKAGMFGSGQGAPRGNAKRQMTAITRWHERTMKRFNERAAGPVKMSAGHASASQVNWASARQQVIHRPVRINLKSRWKQLMKRDENKPGFR